MAQGRLFRRHLIISSEHGAWIWWIGPLLIGFAAAGGAGVDGVLLSAAALSAFLLRQPATILVKTLSGRRPRSDLRPATAWLAADTVVLIALTLALVGRSHSRVFVLALPGTFVFAWHLLLTSRREERGQMGVEIVGAGTLALAAPGAYWVAGGGDPALPWILWMLCWLQSAASIVLVYFRLGFRKLSKAPHFRERLRVAGRSLLYHAFNFTAAVPLAITGRIPAAIALAFALMLVDAIESVYRPPVGRAPTRIGLRQLAASSLFVVLSISGFALE